MNMTLAFIAAPAQARKRLNSSTLLKKRNFFVKCTLLQLWFSHRMLQVPLLTVLSTL